jgi:hypothetical protein
MRMESELHHEEEEIHYRREVEEQHAEARVKSEENQAWKS